MLGRQRYLQALSGDLKVAVASMARRFAIPDSEYQSDEQLTRMLKNAGVHDDEIVEAMESKTMAAERFEAGINEQAAALARKLSQFTWFSTEALPGIANTAARGSLDRTSLADILFSSDMARGIS